MRTELDWLLLLIGCLLGAFLPEPLVLLGALAVTLLFVDFMVLEWFRSVVLLAFDGVAFSFVKISFCSLTLFSHLL